MLPVAVTGTARQVPSLTEPQTNVVQTFSNAIVGQSMWGRRADGNGILILLGSLGRALASAGKAVPVAQYKDPKLGDHSAAPLPPPCHAPHRRPRPRAPLPATPRDRAARDRAATGHLAPDLAHTLLTAGVLR